MSVSIINPGVGGITVETDPTALKLTGGAISGDLTVAQKVGIGGVVPVGATNKLAVHNGNVVFTNGFGLSFGDGSTLTSSSNIARTNVAGSFTAKQTFTAISGVSGINIGIGGTDTGSTTPGDLWITTNGANLNFRDGTGAWKVLASLSNGNVFSQPQTIQTSATATLPALRITQQGTGHALLVEDETPAGSEPSPFVVLNNGQVVIGSLTPVGSNKLTINGGLSVQGGISGSTLTLNGTDLKTYVRAEGDKQYLAKILATPLFLSWNYDSATMVSTITLQSVGEIEINMLNNFWSLITVNAVGVGGSNSFVPTSFSGGNQLTFNGDISGSGAYDTIWWTVDGYGFFITNQL